jgi:L-threonylcarbamoyladenylate synthase
VSQLVSIAEQGPDAAREALDACIAAGGVALFPADGLYGLACDPMSPTAVERIHELKRRPPRKSSAVMYFSPLTMRELLPSLGPQARAALGALLPGPVTAVIANPDERYPLACREDPRRLGVRLIEGPLTGARQPIFQTSANISGEEPAGAFSAVDLELIRAVDLAIDGGVLTGSPSTVVDVSEIDPFGRWSVLREGAMSEAEVRRRLSAALS